MTAADEMDGWSERQNDPNNWLKVPEFGIAPEDVAFEGFSWPIVGPEGDPLDYLESVRGMVGVARTHAKLVFGSQAKLYEAATHAWDAFDSGTDPASWDQKQAAALRFTLMMQALQGAVSCRGKQTLPRVLKEVAFAASMLADFLVNRPALHLSSTLERMKRGASVGGKRSGLARRRASEVPSTEELRRQRDELVRNGRDVRNVASLLGVRHNCSADYIRKKLRGA